MSQDFLDPEILADFFMEAKEHLETIEPNLLELEQNPDNLGLLNEIFRPMHSLKGASGFLGLNKINGLAHKAENILDELRQGSLTVSSAIMDLILSATDALRNMVENLEAYGSEGDLDTTPIINRLDAALAGELEPEAEAAPAQESQPVQQPAEAIAEPPTAPEAVEAAAPAPQDTVTEQPESRPMPEFTPVPDPDFDPTPYSLTTVGEGHLSDFLEEAQEIIENLNSSLLALEGNPDGNSELVNDTFRYFHNLKGNSGIIGFKELNGLTHEAETLLNYVRKGEMPCTQQIVDLMLYVVDRIEELVNKVEVEEGRVTPLDISMLVQVLQKVTETGDPAYASIILGESGETSAQAAPEKAPETKAQSAQSGQEETSQEAPVQEFDPEDAELFEQTISQQIQAAVQALKMLRDDSSQSEVVNGLFRSLQTIQNSAGYMGFGDIRTYAERTLGLVDQGRKSDMDFGLMLDLLDQEFDILKDMLDAALETVRQSMDPSAQSNEHEGASPEPEPVAAPKPKPEVSAEAAPEPKPEPAPAPQPAPEPEQKAEPAPEPAAETVKPAAQPKQAENTPAQSTRSAMSNVKAAVQADQGNNASAAPAKHKASTTIRVDHHRLDHLMNLIGELIINRNRYSMLARALEEGEEEVHVVAQQLTETTYAMARISDDLQDTIMKVRMVPVQTVFSRFPRLVRDLSRKSGKQVELIMEGEETELDKSVVEEIGDPLVHLVRNAVDHGLEDEQERVQNGKSVKGHVWLRAYHKGNSVAIEVEDDGRGIDPDRMRATAVKKGVMSQEEVNALDDREAIELIFHPGFSSADKITDISGRGVGMDVVKTNIKNLKGSVHTQSEVGKGTKLTLTLPLTLAIIDALMVQVAGDTFAIPLDAVSETTKLERSKLSDVNSRKAATMRGEVLGIVELAELLDLAPSSEERDILPVVVIHDNDRRLGLVVDRLLERQEIVIKPLGQYLNNFNLKGLSGATIMGDGSVVLILDPHEVYSLSTQLTRQPGGGSGNERQQQVRGSDAQALPSGK
ncbi:chemotaxis protein CheA [Desulfovibrio oxyclinae]|uniref:chemotaxis protein CheA n=1 Tax=Desulfovibrio oxyclinae TaxID=63560 RepID=UPI0003605601|nr:chemotaxis protein CheA [Desulfovibrio oxyclinae]